MSNHRPLAIPGSAGRRSRDRQLFVHLYPGELGPVFETTADRKGEMMKGKKFVVLILVLILGLAGTSVLFAQTSRTNESMLLQASHFLQFFRGVVKELSKELSQARKDRDSKKTQCIAPRLVDLQRLLSESEACNKDLRNAAFERKPAKIREEFTKLRKKQLVVEQ